MWYSWNNKTKKNNSSNEILKAEKKIYINLFYWLLISEKKELNIKFIYNCVLQHNRRPTFATYIANMLGIKYLNQAHLRGFDVYKVSISDFFKFFFVLDYSWIIYAKTSFIFHEKLK
jgi:hypothetical protein